MTTQLHAHEREDFRQSTLSIMRHEGQVPAVVYGTNVDSKALYINASDFLKTIREVGRNGVISLDLDGETYDVILSDYQMDPIKKEILHADFLAVDMSKEIQVNVRVTLVGEAAGVKDGGVLQQPLHEVSITATPADIPQVIEVDVSNLQVGETMSIADIQGRTSYHINNEDEETIVSILPPRQEKEISTGEEQEPGIPENLEGRETGAVE
ncbi:50S ribosomal protein L25/general stress protein Ctc [Robertmurraya korlensis]|uniref:50S ribosomal protein L25/general stress protein Ctc n=1 Tax=Robertmurraya korlensis TaxID=519977 RepID=UPI0020409908|nr:50S ribosomal protein L25/general stress protein Ctc [Robertmurraya korlensis]MCM3603646.1 50S ribosomal protein L25/general stress protein Ctc [Robertmurraya korlensis]